MDRARRAHAGGAGRGRRLLKRAITVAILAVGCHQLTGEFSDVIAIEYGGPSALRLEEGDTLRVTARALDLRGEPVDGAHVVWRILEIDTGQVGMTLDSLTGLITAVVPGGPWRIQGRVEELRTDPPITVTVTAAPDSLAAVDSARVTVAAGATISPALAAVVLDNTTVPGEETPLAGVSVTYRLIDPAPGTAAADGVAVGVQGVVGDDPHVAEATTLANGQALATVHRVGATQPDSAVVHAVAVTARGDTVPGSPVAFVVVFVNN